MVLTSLFAFPLTLPAMGSTLHSLNAAIAMRSRPYIYATHSQPYFSPLFFISVIPMYCPERRAAEKLFRSVDESAFCCRHWVLFLGRLYLFLFAQMAIAWLASWTIPGLRQNSIRVFGLLLFFIRMSRSQAECLRGEDTERVAARHSLLKQDYRELQREIRALKRRIQRAKLKKENLFGVVRFLRRRYKMLKGMASEKPARKLMTCESGPDTLSVDKRYEFATRAISILEKKAAPLQEIGQERYLRLDGCKRGSRPLVARDIDMFSEPLRTSALVVGESFKKSLIESNESVKESPNGLIASKRSGKRKISWQDEDPLKV